MHYRRVKTTGTTDAHDWRTDPIKRFLSKVAIARNGCWLWTATTTARGYGMFSPGVGPKMESAHRWSYRTFIAPIPAGMQVGHVCHDESRCRGGDTCRHRRCVNPAHLRPMTNRENVIAGNRARGVVATEESLRIMARRAARRAK